MQDLGVLPGLEDAAAHGIVRLLSRLTKITVPENRLLAETLVLAAWRDSFWVGGGRSAFFKRPPIFGVVRERRDALHYQRHLSRAQRHVIHHG